LSDGAGSIVLEEYEHAKERGATIYAELTGFGMSDDAHHITAPIEDGSGARTAMENALNDAALQSESVDYINAHGTSTPAGDVAEAKAIQDLFGAHANLLVSSTKSATGHLLGAAGAIESIFCILAMRDSVVPPTLNVEIKDASVLLDVVPKTARKKVVDIALSNSFGFGGTNASLVFAKLKD
jgi:3-oxoacyl-[acyl-carrier-protein] synthase II